ncbi:hypothetical protein CL622_04260 [archaeon]|nr:hypothetical protein [archaeon]|tara:strand:- start:2449 stop:3021 length:573 start_codon:yes stop_codon:yes gene_type:complete
MATYADYEKKRELFVKGGDNPFSHLDADGNTPLMVAIKNHNEGLAILMLEDLKAKTCKLDHVNKDGDTALILAARDGYHDRLIEHIVQYYPDECNAGHVNKAGQTALIVAADSETDRWTTISIAEFADANPSHMDKRGNTAMNYLLSTCVSTDDMGTYQSQLERLYDLEKEDRIQKENDSMQHLLKGQMN